VYKFTDGREYKGYWNNGKMDGIGDLTYPTQDPNGVFQALRGYFKNNLFN